MYLTGYGDVFATCDLRLVGVHRVEGLYPSRSIGFNVTIGEDVDVGWGMIRRVVEKSLRLAMTDDNDND